MPSPQDRALWVEARQCKASSMGCFCLKNPCSHQCRHLPSRMAVVLVICRNHQCLWMWCQEPVLGSGVVGWSVSQTAAGKAFSSGGYTIVLHQILQCQKLRQLILRHALLYHLRIVIGTFQMPCSPSPYHVYAPSPSRRAISPPDAPSLPGKCFFYSLYHLFDFPQAMNPAAPSPRQAAPYQ